MNPQLFQIFNRPGPLSWNVIRPLFELQVTWHVYLNLETTEIETPGRYGADPFPVVHYKGRAQSIDDVRDLNLSSDIITGMF